MYKTIFTILILFAANLINAQTSDLLTIKHFDSDNGIKNVNVIIPSHDTTLVTDTAGMADLSEFQKLDTLIIKKFGYKNQIVTDCNGQIQLERDSTLFSHDLKLLDLKHKDGFSFIQLSINGENYWFKQKGGSLYLGNGLEIENSTDYVDIFKNHEIIKTINVDAFNCLSTISIIGENYANYITAIYYNPEIKKKASIRIPSMTWYSKRKMRRDLKSLKLEKGCLD